MEGAESRNDPEDGGKEQKKSLLSFNASQGFEVMCVWTQWLPRYAGALRPRLFVGRVDDTACEMKEGRQAGKLASKGGKATDERRPAGAGLFCSVVRQEDEGAGDLSCLVATPLGSVFRKEGRRRQREAQAQARVSSCAVLGYSLMQSSCGCGLVGSHG